MHVRPQSTKNLTDAVDDSNFQKCVRDVMLVYLFALVYEPAPLTSSDPVLKYCMYSPHIWYTCVYVTPSFLVAQIRVFIVRESLRDHLDT